MTAARLIPGSLRNPYGSYCRDDKPGGHRIIYFRVRVITLSHVNNTMELVFTKIPRVYFGPLQPRALINNRLLGLRGFAAEGQALPHAQTVNRWHTIQSA